MPPSAFDDAQAKLKASLIGFDQSLTGDFGRDLVGIQTKADCRHGEPHLRGHPLPQPGAARTSPPTCRRTWRRSPSRSRTPSSGSTTCGSASPGSASTAGKNIGLDLAFKAPSTKFRHILSLVPAVYAHDFQSVQAVGHDRGLRPGEGRVRGQRLSVVRARTPRWTTAPSSIPTSRCRRGTSSSTSRSPTPAASADSTVVRLERFHLLVGRDPVDATMVLRTPLSDPDVDLRVKGKVDLADVRRTMKLEGIDQLTGTVAADAAVRTRMSYIDKKQYDKVAARGSVDVGEPHGQGQGPAASARDPAGVAPAGPAARGAQAPSRDPSAAATSRRPAPWRTCSASCSGTMSCAGARPCGATGSTWTNGGPARATCRSSRCRRRSISGWTRPWRS